MLVIRRPLLYPADWPAVPASEKGIDVAIAVDMVRLAMEQAYDAAILVSSDTDLMPAIEAIIDLRLGHVEIAAWNGPSVSASGPHRTSFRSAISSAKRSTGVFEMTRTTPGPDRDSPSVGGESLAGS